MSKCPRCGSPQPHLHPAVQFEGEVELCHDEFHLTETPQNTKERIASVNGKRRHLALAEAFDEPGHACDRCGEAFDFGEQIAESEGDHLCMLCFAAVILREDAE